MIHHLVLSSIITIIDVMIFIIVLIMICLLFLLILLNKKYNQLKNNYEILKDTYSFEKSYHSLMKQEMKNIKQLRHNIKHTLYLIAHYIQQSNNERALEYIETLLNHPLDHTCIHTGIDALDALIEYKKSIIESLGIEYKEKYILDVFHSIDLSDILIIIGHLFDMIININHKHKVSQSVTFQINHQNNLCHIILENKLIKSFIKHFNMPRDHIESIETIVNHYNGHLFHHTNNEEHSIVICLIDNNKFDK